MSSGAKVERDYSGVPTAQLAKLYEEHTKTDIRTFAARIGMDERDLKKVVVTQNYPFTGLKVADDILIGLGLNISWLVRSGEVTIVPAHERWKSAQRMVEDEVWGEKIQRFQGFPWLGLDEEGQKQWEKTLAELPAPPAEEMESRIAALTELRRTLCVETAEQRDRLDRDAARSRARLARKAASS